MAQFINVKHLTAINSEQKDNSNYNKKYRNSAHKNFETANNYFILIQNKNHIKNKEWYHNK